MNYPPIIQFENNSLPQPVISCIDENKHNMGIYTIKDIDNKDFYILITMGEKYTGGYSIQINRVYQENSFCTIDIYFNSPSEDDIVVQEITYPILVLKKQTEKKLKIRIIPNSERDSQRGGETDGTRDGKKGILDEVIIEDE